MPAVTALRHGPLLIAWAQGAAARAAVLQHLLESTGVATDAVSHACPHCGASTHGPLRSSSGTVVVSLSHADELTVGVIATADAAASVGVDVEALRPDRRADTVLVELTALFAPAAPPTLREWTMIEAAVKADGRGLRIAPGDVILDGAQAQLPGRAPFEIIEIDGPAGHLVSVAIDPAPSSPRAPESGR